MTDKMRMDEIRRAMGLSAFQIDNLIDLWLPVERVAKL